MNSKIVRLLASLIIAWSGTASLQAQLDTIHWIPPMFASGYEGDQFIDLSTPELIPFAVTIANGAGTPLQTVMISRNKAFRYKLSSTYSQLVVPDNALQVVLPSSGLMIHGPKAFHAGFRFISKSEDDALYLTCKGRSAMGTIFRIGNMWQVSDKTGLRKNMVGVMATENGTEVTFSGYDPTLVEFPGGPVKATLQKGESIVYTHYVGGIGDDQPRNGFMGALVNSTKPVVVSSGSWMGAPVIYDQANDIGVDQLLPLEQVGKDYILCMGDGPTNLEHPIVIAHYKDTKVWVNGEPFPDTTLQPGQYYVIPTLPYLPRGNMYVRTSEPAFMYQMIGGFKTGSSSLKTPSLMVVPPIQCGLPKSLDNIYLPNTLNIKRFDGRLMIVAQRFATVKVWVEGVERTLADPLDVHGNEEFVTYSTPDFFSRVRTDSTMRIQSNGAILVSMVLRNKDASYAAMFSGTVERKPSVQLSIQGDGICPDTILAEGVFDGLQWMYDDSLLQEGTISNLSIYAPGKYKAIAYLNGCMQTATVLDSIQASLTAPSFQYSVENPSCFGEKDGVINLEMPVGGIPPYQYSVDFGKHFSSTLDFEDLGAGPYKIIVTDVSGCYNEPIRLELIQPDPVLVNLFFQSLPKPLRPGDEVILEGNTNGKPILSSYWTPLDSTLCADCLVYTFHPQSSGWVNLQVVDEIGCPGEDSIWVQVTPAVYAPNVIYPGSVLGNESFMLYSEYPLLVKHLKIFSRWGELVFEQKDFLTNNNSSGWNAVFHGKELPAGVYTFEARIEVEAGRFEEIRGDISVVR